MIDIFIDTFIDKTKKDISVIFVISFFEDYIRMALSFSK